jgi:hypothetical protein
MKGLMACVLGFAGLAPREPARSTVRRLPLMLQRRNISLPARLQGAAAREASLAAARCDACRATRLCDEWLAAGDAGAYRGFCPNTHYVEQLRTRRLA